MGLRDKLPMFDLNRVDENSSEAGEEECDRMTGKKWRQISPTLSDGPPFPGVRKRKRGQTLLRSDETRPELYEDADYMRSKGVVVEETKVRVSKSKLDWLVEAACMELKVINGKEIENRNESAELPADWRQVVKRKGGKNPKLVISKQITATDLNDKNSRFQIPERQIVRSDFLSEEEKEALKQIHNRNKREKRKEGMEVKLLIEPSFKEHKLKLREWPMNRNNNYVLLSGWNSAIKKEKENEAIKVGDTVQLWSFRCDDDDKLWFLLRKVGE